MLSGLKSCPACMQAEPVRQTQSERELSRRRKIAIEEALPAGREMHKQPALADAIPVPVPHDDGDILKVVSCSECLRTAGSLCAASRLHQA